jgi:hypothetical protein
VLIDKYWNRYGTCSNFIYQYYKILSDTTNGLELYKSWLVFVCLHFFLNSLKKWGDVELWYIEIKYQE